MSHLTLLYCRRWSAGSALIRLGGWFARWSHVAILTPDDTVLESVALWGVCESPLHEWMVRYSEVERVEVECPAPEVGINWARSRVGAGYDYRAVVNFILRKLGQDAARWHCVEFAETALAMAGRARFRSAPYRITPQQSYSVI